MGFSLFGIGNNEPKVQYTALINTIIGERVASCTLSADEYLKKANEAVYGRNQSIFTAGNIIGGALGATANIFKNQKEYFVNYDQNSINETMWAKADKNNNGYVDDNELKDLYGDFVTANDGLKISGKSLLLGAIGVGISLFNKDDYTPEQCSQINEYYLADKKLDSNNDGILSKDEFQGAAINYILTPQNKPKDEEQD